jgi:hypothetical protein
MPSDAVCFQQPERRRAISINASDSAALQRIPERSTSSRSCATVGVSIRHRPCTVAAYYPSAVDFSLVSRGRIRILVFSKLKEGYIGSEVWRRVDPVPNLRVRTERGRSVRRLRIIGRP